MCSLCGGCPSRIAAAIAVSVSKVPEVPTIMVGRGMTGAREDRIEHLPHISFERRDLAGLGRVGLEEAFGQSHHPELEALAAT